MLFREAIASAFCSPLWRRGAGGEVLLLLALGAAPGLAWDRSSLLPFATHTGRFYRYAPCTVMVGKTEFCWNCQNAVEGVIKDSVFLTERAKGRVTANRPALMAGPAGAWDSFHVCDPSVVAGKFRFGGHPYQYALFYLGNDVNASRHNQIGVAFSNDLGGPWTRSPVPLIPHADDGSWGVGQPSALVEDDPTHVRLFYTCGDRAGTRLLCRTFRLQSDAATPTRFESGPDVTVPTVGLTDSNGHPDTVLHNADLAYDSLRHRYWIVREQHSPRTDAPRYISAGVQLASIPIADLRRGVGTWRVEGDITPALTGLPRNHNAGLVRALSGALPDPHHVRVVFTSSCAGPDCKVAEWSYDLWEITGTFP